MKRIVASLAVLALAACGEKAAETPAPAEPAAVPAAAEPAPEPTPATTPAPDAAAPAADPGATGAAPAAVTPAAAPAAAPGALPPPYDQADLEEGKQQFAKCRNCHSLVEADGNLVGPNLHGVFARHPGTTPKFRYSDAMKTVKLERWTPEELDKWLADPKGYLPGSSMFFNGIDKADARRDVIAYLMKNS